MSQNDYTWEYNGESYELDLMDTKTLKLFLDVSEEVEKTSKELEAKRNEDIIAYADGTCDMIYHFFDTLFGAGTSDKLFEKKYNLRACAEVYFESFMPFANVQMKNAGIYFDRFRSKKAVPQNREQRRHGNKNRNRH